LFFQFPVSSLTQESFHRIPEKLAAALPAGQPLFFDCLKYLVREAYRYLGHDAPWFHTKV
jgi:hypothetical protein